VPGGILLTYSYHWVGHPYIGPGTKKGLRVAAPIVGGDDMSGSTLYTETANLNPLSSSYSLSPERC
jgi:hypothetical protein